MILVNVHPSIFTKRFYDKGLNLLTEEQAAAKCSIATHELSKMRERGEGPNCLCFEGADFSWLYPLDTLEEWLFEYRKEQRAAEESRRKLQKMLDR